MGRAVHATLESIDVRSAREVACEPVPSAPALRILQGIAASQARAERIPDRAGEIARLAIAALRSPTVKAAFQAGSLRREIYVATTIGQVVLDGFVDLCYVDGQGLTVVDYKTDEVRDRSAVEEIAERYSLQAAAYALSLSDATGAQISRCVLVFLSPREPIEFEVRNLAELVQQVKDLVGSAA